MNDKVKKILKIIVFLVSVFLVIYGQKTIGRNYLFLQLIGLAGLITLLWDYNRKFV